MVEQLSLPGFLFRNDDSDHVRRRRDAFVAEADFPLAAMMRYVQLHCEEDFAPRQLAVGELRALPSCSSVRLEIAQSNAPLMR